MFIVDSSGSICDNDPSKLEDVNGNPIDCDNWGLVKEFVGSIVDQLVIGVNDAHVALIRFSSLSSVIFGLDR